MQGLKVRSLVGKLRSHMLCGIAKKEEIISTCQQGYLFEEVKSNFFSFLCFPVYSETNIMNTDCFFCMGAQSCPALCNPMDYSPLVSPVCGIIQARILERVAISYSRESSRPGDWTHMSCKSPALQSYSLSLNHWRSPWVYITFIIEGGRGNITFLKTCTQTKIYKDIQLLSPLSRKCDSYLC